MSFSKRVCVGIIMYIFLSAKVYPQSSLMFPFNKKISTENGLSSYNIKKIIQDKYGFIWIGTQDGLNRYDGKNFLIYNKSALPKYQISGNDIWDMQEDIPRDILWVISAYGGLDAINLKTGAVSTKINSKTLKEQFNNTWLKCIKLYKNTLWIGTNDGLIIYNIDTGKFEEFEQFSFGNDTRQNASIDRINLDEYDNIWLFVASQGIIIYSAVSKNIIQSTSLAKISLKLLQPYNQFHTITAIAKNELLTGTNQGFRRLKYTKLGIAEVMTSLFDKTNDHDSENIIAASIDPEKQVWFSTSSQLFRADLIKSTVKEVKDANLNGEDDWLSYVNDIFIDGSDNIWLASRKGIMYTRNAPPLFSPFNVSRNQSFRINHAYSICPVNDSIVYVASETGLLKINTYQDDITPVGKKELYYFVTTHDDRLLVSSKNDLLVFNSQQNAFYPVSQFYPELKPLDHITINSFVYLADSLAFIGTEKSQGFYIWNYKSKILKSGNQDAVSSIAETNIVNTCYKASDSMMWVLSDNLITIYNPFTQKATIKRFTDPVSHAPISLFFDAAEAGGYTWIAAYSTGIIQIDKSFRIRKIFTDKEGLSNTGVYKIFPANDSLLFISTNNGLSVLNINTNSFVNFYQNDGLNSNSFEEACGTYSNGNIYLGGVNGFTILEPKTFSYNKMAPNLYINNIRIETSNGVTDTTNIKLTSLEIPNSVLQITITFSALNYSNPLRTSFSYKVKDLNKNWVNIGNENFINLIGLGPGKHILLVRSSNENGIWNNTPLEIDLIYLPKWYQTLIFKITAILIILGAFYLFYSYRISQLKKQQQIRKDIASDLHDDLGGTLNSVKTYTHLAQKNPQNSTYLSYLEDSITQAITGLKDMLWVLDDSQDSIYGFEECIKKFILPVTIAKDINFQCTIDGELGSHILSKGEKRHVLMIVKECVNNSIKYAECKSIKLGITKHEFKLRFTIEDDGKGFDMFTVSKGNGLKNIVTRCAQIKYKSEIISAPGKGTLIRIEKI